MAGEKRGTVATYVAKNWRQNDHWQTFDKTQQGLKETEEPVKTMSPLAMSLTLDLSFYSFSFARFVQGGVKQSQWSVKDKKGDKKASGNTEMKGASE